MNATCFSAVLGANRKSLKDRHLSGASYSCTGSDPDNIRICRGGGFICLHPVFPRVGEKSPTRLSRWPSNLRSCKYGARLTAVSRMKKAPTGVDAF